MRATVRHLGYDADLAHLWDDNTRLEGEPGVAIVPPFVKLAPAQRDRVLGFLNECLPPSSLDPDLVDFMLGANEKDAALVRDPVTNRLAYHLGVYDTKAEQTQVKAWPLPPHHLLLRSAGVVSEEEGLAASDVTPENEKKADNLV